MRLGFDFDGVITDGKYLDLAAIPTGADLLEIYNTLTPYDSDTKLIWNQLCAEHDCWIMTARGSGKQAFFKESFDSVLGWLQERGFTLPRGIYTAVGAEDKLPILENLHIDRYFDDCPAAFTKWNPTYNLVPYLINNPNSLENQAKSPWARLSSWKEIDASISTR